LESPALLQPAPSPGFSPPPQRRHPPSPMQAASAFNAFAFCALWPFRRQRPPALHRREANAPLPAALT